MVAAAVDEDGFVQHRGHRVWWGRALSAEPGSRVPLLTVHGGPGICHDCLEPLAALAPARPVVFYDQYGCGLSDRAERPEEYDVELFVDEIDALRSELALDEVHLFAHSYGGPLVLEYLLRARPAGVRSLILSNSFASVPALSAGWCRRIGELSSSARDALSGGSAPTTDEYAAALGEFLGRFVLPFTPPEPLLRSQQKSGSGVYTRMHGSSWFSPDGVWSGWDVTDRLREIDVPTLVIGGTRDQCVPELAETMAERLPRSELVVLDSAHLPFFEVEAEYRELVGSFLDRIDGSG
jgi:proline-specific peptidase